MSEFMELWKIRSVSRSQEKSYAARRRFFFSLALSLGNFLHRLFTSPDALVNDFHLSLPVFFHQPAQDDVQWMHPEVDSAAANNQ